MELLTKDPNQVFCFELLIFLLFQLSPTNSEMVEPRSGLMTQSVTLPLRGTSSTSLETGTDSPATPLDSLVSLKRSEMLP